MNALNTLRLHVRICGACVFLCHDLEFLYQILPQYLRIRAKFPPHQVSPFQTLHVPIPPPLRYRQPWTKWSFTACGFLRPYLWQLTVAGRPPRGGGGSGKASPPVACTSRGCILNKCCWGFCVRQDGGWQMSGWFAATRFKRASVGGASAILDNILQLNQGSLSYRLGRQ